MAILLHRARGRRWFALHVRRTVCWSMAFVLAGQDILNQVAVRRSCAQLVTLDIIRQLLARLHAHFVLEGEEL